MNAVINPSNTCAAFDLRPMTTADLHEVVEVEMRSFPFPWTYGVFVDSLHSGYRAWVARECADGNAGSKPGKIVGYALMMVVLDEVHLLNITVEPSQQRRGFGKALLNHLFNDARALGCKFMFLEVRPSNTNALEMYRRFGFVVIGERRGYYPATNGREDAIVMSCDIATTVAAAVATNKAA